MARYAPASWRPAARFWVSLLSARTSRTNLRRMGPALGIIIASENPGNGNGVIEAGEGASLVIALNHMGGVKTVTGVTATHTTSTPYVYITQPFSCLGLVGMTFMIPGKRSKASIILTLLVLGASMFAVGCGGSSSSYSSAPVSYNGPPRGPYPVTVSSNVAQSTTFSLTVNWADKHWPRTSWSPMTFSGSGRRFRRFTEIARLRPATLIRR